MKNVEIIYSLSISESGSKRSEFVTDSLVGKYYLSENSFLPRAYYSQGLIEPPAFGVTEIAKQRT